MGTFSATGISVPHDANARINPRMGDEEIARNVIADLAKRPALNPHIVTFANEKGGVGKSTLAFHVAIALAHTGARVVAIDLDRRQRTLERGLSYRNGTAGNLGVALPMPQFGVVDQPSTACLYQTIARLGAEADFVILDAAGADSPIFRRVVALADTLVTPVNASFLDLELLGRVSPLSGMPDRAGCFGQTVAALREEKLAQKMGRIEWVVVKNRVRAAEKRHLSRIDDALERLATAHDFRVSKGLSERLAFRELFQFGLTHLDLGLIPDMIRPQASTCDEISTLVADLGFSFRQHDAAQAAALPSRRVLRRTRHVFREALSAAL